LAGRLRRGSGMIGVGGAWVAPVVIGPFSCALSCVPSRPFGAGFGTGTFAVPAVGGRPAATTTLRDASAGDHRFPWFLPDGRHFLYVDTNSKPDATGAMKRYDVGSVYVVMFEPGTRNPILRLRLDKPLEMDPAKAEATINAAVAELFTKYPTRRPKK